MHRQTTCEFSLYEINEIDQAFRVDVVNREWPSNERIVATSQPQHGELARDCRGRNLWGSKTDTKRIARDGDVFDNRRCLLNSAIGVIRSM